MMAIETLTKERVSFIDYRGTKILLVDFSKSSGELMIETMNHAAELGKRLDGNVNIVANFKSTPKSTEFNKRLKEIGKEYKSLEIDVKLAALGIDSTFKRVVVNATIIVTKLKNVKLFETKAQALEWIASG